jgi:hypothetical protein
VRYQPTSVRITDARALRAIAGVLNGPKCRGASALDTIAAIVRRSGYAVRDRPVGTDTPCPLEGAGADALEAPG